MSAFTCPLCGTTSHHPGDAQQRYCARCHLFLDVVYQMRAAVAGGAPHVCADWRTARRTCAICHRVLPPIEPTV